jgi:hypothetical protein
MLEESAIPRDSVGDDGVDPEIMVAYREAHRVARLAAQAADLDPEDVESAVESFRDVYRALINKAGGPAA